MDNTTKQSQKVKILSLLTATGSTGINSFDTARIYRIGRVAARVNELRKEGYLIVTKHNKDHSVNYILAETINKKPEKKESPIEDVKSLETFTHGMIRQEALF